MKIALDFDGTIVNSWERHFIALEKASGKLNVKLWKNWRKDYYIEKRLGNSTKDIVMEKIGLEADKLAKEWFQIIEKDIFVKDDYLYPDVLRFLTILKNGNTLHLVTARSNEKAFENLIKKLKLKKYFDEILCVSPGRDAGKRKAESLSYDDIQIVIGDTESDLHWAKIMNAEFYPVNWGFRSREFWDKKMILSYNNYSEIINKLGSYEV